MSVWKDTKMQKQKKKKKETILGITSPLQVPQHNPRSVRSDGFLMVYQSTPFNAHLHQFD